MRGVLLAVDENDSGEIYIARFLPRAKVNSYAEQNFGSGDDPVTWGVTLIGEEDSDLGYSEQWIFGGAGWNAQPAALPPARIATSASPSAPVPTIAPAAKAS